MRQKGTDPKLNLATPQNSFTPVFVTSVLFIVAATTIVIATWMLWDLPWGSGTRQIVISIFNGMLLTIPIFIANWTVLGAQTAIVRVPLATASLVALLAVYFWTLYLMQGNMPAEVYTIFGTVAGTVSLSAHAVLWPVWFFFHPKITRLENDSYADSKSQFSVRHLFVATTIFAISLPILQSFAKMKIADFSTFPLSEVLGFCGIFIVVLAFLTFLAIQIVFANSLRKLSILLLVMVICGVPFLAVPSIQLVVSRSFTAVDQFDMGLNVMAFTISNSLTQIAVYMLYYAIGFRLRRVK